MAGAVSFVMTSREARRFGDGPVFCRTPRATRRMKAVRRAFSLAEVLIVLAILAALGGSVLSVGAIWGRPTAAKEADRAMRWLYSVVARADLAGRPFDLRVDERAQRLQVRWEKPMDVEQLSARSGCTLQRIGASSAAGHAHYAPQWGTFSAALTVLVRDAEGRRHFLILSGQGQIRTSAHPPAAR
ncbi:prepilin-type N-terminal cleavage/methylation domain-containing protein [uncultured Fretibacterium sp.]|uniref:type II secretion system protein n=1 Tax=uncultured Fretibacterium sp. TaxID=1678694 RepID=UPI002605700D|nr:prepilin-type N-terminal cleavage/methylation domain-containing protein [uncultured Fretibacterium sp.]